MSQCPFCGARAQRTNRNCSQCGALLEWDDNPTAPKQSPDSGDLPAAVRDILEVARSQGKIATIKRYREVHRVGLKEAKEKVEQLMDQHGIVAGTGTGCAAVLVVAIVWLVTGALAAAN